MDEITKHPLLTEMQDFVHSGTNWFELCIVHLFAKFGFHMLADIS
jgi:hypothetical protein